MSLDGYVAPAKGAPDHRSAPEDTALKQLKLDWLRQAGTHAMGRVTYQEMAEHWPTSSDIIAWGGATFVQSLSRAGLVDEYRLVISPVALGDGLPLFKDLSAPLQLELVEATTYATGAAFHIYRPVS
jgi:dihydrofolate reductase